MRLRLWLLLSLLFPGPAAAALPRQTIAGHPYVDLATWATRQGYHVAWSLPDESMTLTHPAHRFRVKADSRQALIDGVLLRLSYPPVAVRGRLWIAERDVETALVPVLQPLPVRADRRIRTIALNAGHGGKDPGNVEGRHQEKAYALAWAQEVRRRLEAAGFLVQMIRRQDTFVELDDRAARANRVRADLYVSLHFNGVGRPGGGASGVETYCLTPAGASSSNDARQRGGAWHPSNRFDRENLRLAWEVHRQLAAHSGLPDRGVRRARFRELTLLDMPGILVEGGFMDSPADARVIYSAEGRARLARAVVDGILAFQRLTQPAGRR
ncbi:MAG: N-acetylmuramoyl-L-alanine amidase [Verrucomicrobiota bacterium]